MIVVEFMKVFHEECIILNYEVGDAKSTILLWFANFLPSNKSLGSVGEIRFAPQANTPGSVNVVSEQ